MFCVINFFILVRLFTNRKKKKNRVSETTWPHACSSDLSQISVAVHLHFCLCLALCIVFDHGDTFKLWLAIKNIVFSRDLLARRLVILDVFFLAKQCFGFLGITLLDCLLSFV